MPATPLTKCLSCGHKLNRAEHPDSDTFVPDAGDFTVCLYCDCLMVFNADLTLRHPTDAEKRAASVDPDVDRAIAFNREFRRQFPPTH